MPMLRSCAGISPFSFRTTATSKGVDLASLVLDSIEHGSKRVSPFFHFSVEFWEAHKWRPKARDIRQEEDTV